MSTNGSSFFNVMPPVTKNLIIINVIIWLAMMIVPGNFSENVIKYCGLHYIQATDFNPAQLLTYCRGKICGVVIDEDRYNFVVLKNLSYNIARKTAAYNGNSLTCRKI